MGGHMSQPSHHHARRRRAIDQATQRAAHLLVVLDAYRRSPDPGLREAYGDVHELITDLAALHAMIEELPHPDDHDTGPPRRPRRAGGQRRRAVKFTDARHSA
jgi:hypothetical protein